MLYRNLSLERETKMKKLAYLFAMVVATAACSEPEAEAPADIVAKDDVASAAGKGDSADLDRMCEDLGRDPGCDPCAVQGWYGDGSCDDFCPVKDTDCGIDDYAIQVTSAPGISATMNVVYSF